MSMYCKKRLLEVNRLEINFNYKEEKKMKPLKTVRYEWHIMFGTVDKQGNDDGDVDLLHEIECSQYNSIMQVKNFIEEDRENAITDTDITNGYCLAREYIKGELCVYRLRLARYTEEDIELAVVRNNELDDYFDEFIGMLGGTKVPKRFKQEFARHYKWASIL